MIMLGLINRFYRRGYRYLTIFGKVLMAPGFIVIMLGMLLLSIVEFFAFDLLWLVIDFIDDKIAKQPYSLTKAINVLMW